MFFGVEASLNILGSAYVSPGPQIGAPSTSGQTPTRAMLTAGVRSGPATKHRQYDTKARLSGALQKSWWAVQSTTTDERKEYRAFQRPPNAIFSNI
jgi:hypothetical protein